MILTRYTVGVKQRGARAGMQGCRSAARRPLWRVGGPVLSTSSNSAASVGEAPALIAAGWDVRRGPVAVAPGQSRTRAVGCTTAAQPRRRAQG
ncbi:hypothetical protein SKAU_G00125410 [Synaphobranchus kaupii]|uniref:Uncharacterized protein n=1 Tax=Synaphobranchus kaupii TaxID=118154 RepID=A0A9Q1J2X8_SYNKA|nr:hypothetical protein SKAU_G00125410 [Synaphobranchus kaupii]